MAFDTEWTADRIEENKFINQVRERLVLGRRGGFTGMTTTTVPLLEYWRRPERERRLFLCQIEALETILTITGVAGKYGEAWIENDLMRANADANPLPQRMAIKMATGSGKTVVMAMLIAWHPLN
jgi:type III restriction enzyme